MGLGPILGCEKMSVKEFAADYGTCDFSRLNKGKVYCIIPICEIVGVRAKGYPSDTLGPWHHPLRLNLMKWSDLVLQNDKIN